MTETHYISMNQKGKNNNKDNFHYFKTIHFTKLTHNSHLACIYVYRIKNTYMNENALYELYNKMNEMHFYK